MHGQYNDLSGTRTVCELPVGALAHPFVSSVGSWIRQELQPARLASLERNLSAPFLPQSRPRPSIVVAVLGFAQKLEPCSAHTGLA